MDVKLTKSARTTFDGQVLYEAAVDGAHVGDVYRYTENVNHSVNNVLTHVTKRHGWRYEVKAPTANVSGLRERQTARALARPRITWESRKRALAELAHALEVIATLAD